MVAAGAGAGEGRELLDILVTGGTVVTMDADFRVIERGAVALRGGRIAAVGPADEIGARFEALRTIDAAGRIVMPGLIDAHAHAGHGLTKGLAEGRGGSYWLDLMEDLYHRATTPEFWYAEGLLSATERLKFGVTCGLAMPGSSPRVDDLRYAGEGVRAYEEVGLRYVLAIGPPNGPWPRRFVEWESGTPVEREVTLEAALATSEVAIETFNGRSAERIRVSLGPSSLAPGFDPATGEPGAEARLQARALRDLADRYGVGIHAHAYGGMVLGAARAYPELLGRDLSLAHCTGIGPDEVRILADAGVSVVHGPYTHAYIAARCPVIELLEAGVVVAIGTDGSAPDRSFDLLAQVHPAIQLQRVGFADSAVLPAGKALAMVTIDAARALGLDGELGSLEPGKKADLIVIDAGQAHLYPHPAALAPHRLAYAATGADVETVIVNGWVLMERRRLLTVDEADVLALAQREADALLDRGLARDALALPAEFWTGTRYRE